MEFDEERCVVVKERANDTVRAMRVEREDGESRFFIHSQYPSSVVISESTLAWAESVASGWQ
jgi:hypothetical protein